VHAPPAPPSPCTWTPSRLESTELHTSPGRRNRTSLQKHPLCFSTFPIRLSRACLGKCSAFSIKRHTKNEVVPHRSDSSAASSLPPAAPAVTVAPVVRVVVAGTCSGERSCKNGRDFGYQGQLESRKNGFKTRRSSNFRPFWFGSSRFNVQMGAQNGATTQSGSQRRDIHIQMCIYI
jgi:hypothetical protein